MSALRCPACGKLNAQHGQETCDACKAPLPRNGEGAPTPGAAETPSSRARALLPCKKCQAPNPGGARVCHSCGAPLAMRVLDDGDKSPVVAVVLAALFPGAGYIYVGRISRAAVMLTGALVGVALLVSLRDLPFFVTCAVLAVLRVLELADATWIALQPAHELAPLPIDPKHAKSGAPAPALHPGYHPATK